jgi:hypothetical protein
MISHFLFWLLLSKFILAETDCDWLRIIYSKMGGDVQKIPQNCCRMDGVECTEDGYVTAIDWNHQGLSGSIPKELGNLVYLEWL